jgi:nucleoside-diphosphate-sugar epimerase
MNVLITGGTGFVGLNLAEALLARGDRVALFGLDPPPPNAKAVFEKLPGKVVATLGDVRDDAALDRIFHEADIDRVIHAAVITAGQARERRDPRSIMDTNIIGTMAVLQAAQRHPVQRVVVLSSGSVYGTAGNTSAPLREESTTPLPDSLYSISKYAAERAALRVKNLSGLDVVAARLGTVFGPWERETGFRDTMSPIFQTLVHGLEHPDREIVLPRPGLRDWVYARDIAQGVLLLLDAPKLAHEVYNVGSGFRWTIEDWCRRLATRYPGLRHRLSSDLAECTVDLFGPLDRGPLSIDRLNQELGYRPRFDLDAAFTDLMRWLDA